jgi:O-antigen/teichoic acid export membrane protein
MPFLRFGIFVSAKQLMTYTAHRLDEVVIGYFLAPEILGIYHFGKEMLEKIRGLITSAFGKVLFPIFSKLKKNREKLSRAYQRISRYIAFGAFPVFSGIAVTAHLFVPVIFGEKWMGSIIVFQVFSIAMIFLVLTANVSTSLLYSVNKPDMVFYIDVVTNIAYFVSLLLLASYGMIAILVTYSCYIIYKTLILQYFTNSQLIQSFGSYFRELAIPAMSAINMCLAVLFFQYVVSPGIGGLILLLGSILIGSLLFGLMAWYWDQKTFYELKDALIKGELTQ